jgi:hypothetical protein
VKKSGVFLIFVFLAAGNLAALSIGAGAFLGGDLGGGVTTWSGSSPTDRGDLFRTRALPYFGGGGFLFFDAKYVELSFGFFVAGGKYTTEPKISSVPLPYNEIAFTYTKLNFGAFYKHPFSLGKTLSIFPLLGLEYFAVMSVKENAVEIPEPGEFNSLWLKAGGGMDIALNSRLYIRVNALYGLRAYTQFEAERLLPGAAEIDLVVLGAAGLTLPRLGHGPTVKLALGYRF